MFNLRNYLKSQYKVFALKFELTFQWTFDEVNYLACGTLSILNKSYN